MFFWSRQLWFRGQQQIFYCGTRPRVLGLKQSSHENLPLAAEPLKLINKKIKITVH